MALLAVFSRELSNVNLLTMSAGIAVIFLFSLIFVFFFRTIARKIGLVDKPNYRKRHHGFVPLAGGISVYAGLCFTSLITSVPIPHFGLYLACSGLLVFVGILDDRFDISVKIRALVQAIVGVVMMMFADLYLQTPGYIFGHAKIYFGQFGYVVTLFAVWASINAFNMVDGIDGLLGGLSCIAFGALGILFWLSEHFALAFWCFAIIASITPYILLNLGFFGLRYKVFMGDAGSTLLGFTAIWLLLESSQGSDPAIKPVTALWVIAIPLMDMISIMYRRLRKGISPFSPDRQHIHHLIMHAGCTPHQALLLITFAAAILAAVGIVGERLSFVPEWVMLVLFLLAFFLYGRCLKQAWRVAHCLRRQTEPSAKKNKHKF